MEWNISQLSSVDLWIGWAVSTALAAGVQGIASFFSTIVMTVPKQGKKEQVPHPFQFIDPFSIPLFLFAGWGWSKPFNLPKEEFSKKRLYTFLFFMASPLGNLALAGAISTLYNSLLPSAVFKLAIAINTYTAVANLLIPFPPFSLGRGLWMMRFDAPNRGLEWFVISSLTLYTIWAFQEKASFGLDFVIHIGNAIITLLTGQ